MAIAVTNLIGTDIQKHKYHVALVLRWREAGTHWRRIQAETYRIAARICERSENEGWVLDVDVGCALIGGGMIATTITIELAEGDAGEFARAEKLFRGVVQDIAG